MASDVLERIEAGLADMERIGRLLQRSSLGSGGEVSTLRIARGLRAVVAACLPDYEAAMASGDDTTELAEEVLLAVVAMFPAPPATGPGSGS